MKKYLKNWDIVKDKDWNTWLYLYGVFSSYEPDKEKRNKIIEEELNNWFEKLLKVSKILYNN